MSCSLSIPLLWTIVKLNEPSAYKNTAHTQKIELHARIFSSFDLWWFAVILIAINTTWANTIESKYADMKIETQCKDNSAHSPTFSGHLLRVLVCANYVKCAAHWKRSIPSCSHSGAIGKWLMKFWHENCFSTVSADFRCGNVGNVSTQQLMRPFAFKSNFNGVSLLIDFVCFASSDEVFFLPLQFFINWLPIWRRSIFF